MLENKIRGEIFLIDDEKKSNKSIYDRLICNSVQLISNQPKITLIRLNANEKVQSECTEVKNTIIY